MIVLIKDRQYLKFGDRLLSFGCKCRYSDYFGFVYTLCGLITPNLFFEAMLTTLTRLSESLIKIITLPGCK